MNPRLLHAADGIALRTGWLARPLSAERLIAAARRRSGLEEFGPEPIEEPLAQLLDACVAEASLGVVGRLALRWDALRFLTNLLALNEAERQQAAIAREPIIAPIFIAGLPRSGTTFLHRMMLCDPCNRAPRVFETIYPVPAPAEREKREAQVAKQLRMFERMAPEFRGLHRLSARSPQECTEILAHTFRSLRFDTTYRIPSYRRWLEADAARHLPAYRMHKRFLQHLQHLSGDGVRRRWVLKCPDHLFALPALRSVYPDARLVFVHRDPLKVLLSVAKLTEVLRRPFSRDVDPIEIGRCESERWLEGAERMMAAEQQSPASEPICHVHYLDLVADPAATVAALYRHFGLVLPASAAAAIRSADAAEPGGGYGPRRYHFAEHGLDAAAEREKFRRYMVHFGVTPESVEAAERPRQRPVSGLGGAAARPIRHGLPG